MSCTKSSGICLLIAAVLMAATRVARGAGFENLLVMRICGAVILIALLLAILLAFIGLFRSSERSGKTVVFLLIAFGVLGNMGRKANEAQKRSKQAPPVQAVEASKPQDKELSPEDQKVMDSAIDLAIGLEVVSVSFQKSWEKVRNLSKQFEAPVRNKTGYHELSAASQQFETSSNSLAEQIKKQPKMFRARLQANGVAPAEIEKVMAEFTKSYDASSVLALEVFKHSQTVADTVQRLCKQLLAQWDGWEVKEGKVSFTDAAQSEIYQKDLTLLRETAAKQEAAEKRWMGNMPK